MTFFELNERYLHGYLQTHSSYKHYCRIYQQYFAGWCDHPTKAKIRQWHREHDKTPAHSNKGLGYLKAMYNWAINEELWDDANPAAGVRRHPSSDRDRTLSSLELKAVLDSMDFMFWKFRALLLMLAMTGCRLSEALKAEWTHINLDGQAWYKPTTKNGDPQRIPLPAQLCQVLRGMRIKSQGKYVFAGAYDRHLSRAAAEKSWGKERVMLNLSDVRLHDFRRTLGTRLHEQGESRELIKSILNHRKKASDPTDIYVRVSFERQAAALQKQADGLWAMVKTAQDDMQHSLPFTNHMGEARQMAAAF